MEIFCDRGNISRTWENIRGNTKISTTGIVGCYWLKLYYYNKIPYYSGTLIYDSVYGHSVSTHGLFLSFCLNTLCMYSLNVYSELITFLCINLIWFMYCIIITNYYYMYYCSDLFCTVYVVIYWQVLYPLWWIAGILNKWLWLWSNINHDLMQYVPNLLSKLNRLNCIIYIIQT